MSNILDIPREKLTPGMQQYQDAKRDNPDCLILMRMGDFYEIFYQDAITAAKELEITLTSRGKAEKKAPLAGVPYHALENYLAKLVRKGYKVAIIEQLEDPKKAKGLVKRGLVRIVTPGTVIESSLLEEKENSYCMAIIENATNIHFAVCDISTGEFSVSYASNLNQFLHELTRFAPKECIVPQSLLVNKEIENTILSTHCFLTPVEDYHFSSKVAQRTLLEHFSLSSLSSFGLEKNNEKIQVAGALLSYLQRTQKNSLSQIKKIRQHSSNTMLIDSVTLKNLELLKNSRDNSTKDSLLEVLDHTKTAMGARLLRKWIAQPLLDIQIIEKRLDSVELLTKQVIAREEIKEILKQILDLERLISRVNYGSANPRDLLCLRDSCARVPLLKQKLKPLNTALLQAIAKMDSLVEVTKLLQKAVKQETPITLREGGIFKQGYNRQLDELNSLKSDSKKFLQNIEEREKNSTGITTLKIGFNRVFGYFIEVTKKNVHLVPTTYIRKQTTTNSERYITQELKVLEEKIMGAQEKIEILEYDLYQDLLVQTRKYTTAIQKCAQRVAVLDVIASLASCAAQHNYARPQFSELNVLHIKNSRHAVVERKVERFIENDIILNEGEIMIITGPNMAGKSTVMRQTALIVLLAQIGSFVPADECVLGIVDKIFTRVGASDDISSGQSTFMVEMSETANILNNATQRSLIILDEIGRGTSTFDGVSIAWSVAEHIHNKIGAKTLFATHYHVMNKLAEKFSRVKNFNISVKDVKGEIVFLHKLIPGGTDQSYGIHVAQLAGMPYEVVERAREVQTLLEQDDEMIKRIKVKKLDEQKGLGEF